MIDPLIASRITNAMIGPSMVAIQIAGKSDVVGVPYMTDKTEVRLRTFTGTAVVRWNDIRVVVPAPKPEDPVDHKWLIDGRPRPAGDAPLGEDIASTR